MNRGTQNQRATDYNNSVKPILTSLCSPLEKINIHTFTYYRVFDDGQYLFLSNHHPSVEYINQNFKENGKVFQEHIRQSKEGALNYLIWPLSPGSDEVIDYYGSQDICYGLCIYQRQGNSVESWGYATTHSNPNMISYYINNIDIFKNFSSYFNEKAKDLLIPTATKLAAYSNFMNIYPNLPQGQKNLSFFIDNLLTHIPESLTIIGQKGQVNLTSSQLGIFKKYAQGRSSKNIAQELNLSYKTIEWHLTKIKCLLGVSFKSQMNEILRKHPLL